MGTESHSTWLTLLLLVLLPSGIAHFPALNPPNQVNGIVGGSALLPVIISPPQLVSEIEWEFQGKTGLALLIAEFGGDKLERPNPSDRFGRRLEMANKTALRIKALELEDSGAFNARVRLATAAVQEHSFQLAIYEPLPTPRILPQLTSRMPDGCNVTLQCQAFGKGEFSVFWRRGDSSRALEDSSGRYQLFDDNRTLQFSWESSSSDSSFTCLVSNPAEQKRVSFDLLSICPHEGTNCLSWFRIGIVMGLVGQISTVVVLHILERKAQKQT